MQAKQDHQRQQQQHNGGNDHGGCQGIGHELHDDHRQKGQNAQGAADPEAGNEHFHDQQHQTDNEAYDAGHGQAAQKAQKAVDYILKPVQTQEKAA